MGRLNEIIAFYNVENLFLPDEEYDENREIVSSGLWNWDSQRYENKIFKISHVFDLMRSETGVIPMLIGLSEIENDEVLEDLLEKIPFGENYKKIHYNSKDERGIDVAVLYDKTKLELLSSEAISFEFLIHGNPPYYDTTRDVLWCKFKYEENVFNFFVLHLPSKREKDVNQPKRRFILEKLQKKILDILENTNEGVIVSGDFNENPNEDDIDHFMYEQGIHPVLYNPFEMLFAKKDYSTYYRRQGMGFDQIMLSKHFFRSDSTLKYTDAEIFKHKALSNWGRRSQEPFRTYLGTRYLGGYSDHYPVYVMLSNKK